MTPPNTDPAKADIALLSNVDFEGMGKVGESITFAFITPDGEWVGPGRMGWFGMSDATDESRQEYNDKWNQALSTIDHDKTYVVIVDCHI